MATGRFGSVAVRGTVRAVPVFGSDGSSGERGFLCILHSCSVGF